MTRFCLSRNNLPLPKQPQADRRIQIKNSFPAFYGYSAVGAAGNLRFNQNKWGKVGKPLRQPSDSLIFD